MQKKSEDFSMQEAMKLARSDAGQQLLALIQQQGGGSAQQAMDAAKAGDLEKAKQELASLLASPEVQALLAKLRNG